MAYRYMRLMAPAVCADTDTDTADRRRRRRRRIIVAPRLPKRFASRCRCAVGCHDHAAGLRVWFDFFLTNWMENVHDNKWDPSHLYMRRNFCSVVVYIYNLYFPYRKI